MNKGEGRKIVQRFMYTMNDPGSFFFLDGRGTSSSGKRDAEGTGSVNPPNAESDTHGGAYVEYNKRYMRKLHWSGQLRV